MALVKIDPKEYGLEEKSVVVIEKAFEPKIIERDELAKSYAQIVKKDLSPTLCSEASTLRKQLVKVRTGIAAIHQTQKAFFLASGRFVDAWKNKETLPITQMEETLSGIEKHFENIEKERIAKLQEKRFKEIVQYDLNGEIINSNADFGGMSDTVWTNFLAGARHTFEVVKAAEQKAADDERKRLEQVEKERIAKEKAEAEEQERIRKENERLKAEAIERERLAEIEQKKRDKIEAERLEKEKKESARREEILRKEREERERIEQMLHEKEAEEARLKKEAEKKLQAELNMGDADKVKALIVDLKGLIGKYSFKSIKNKERAVFVDSSINNIIDHIKS